MQGSRDQYWENFRKQKDAHKGKSSSAEFRAIMETEAYKHIDALLALAKEEWPGLIDAKFKNTFHAKLHWADYRNCSRGGVYKLAGKIRPGISIGMIRGTLPIDFIEYAAYNDHPEYGYYTTQSSSGHLACIIAHELAHAIQYYFRKKVLTMDAARAEKYKTWARNVKPHGKQFRTIYRVLRVKYVNNLPKIDGPFTMTVALPPVAPVAPKPVEIKPKRDLQQERYDHALALHTKWESKRKSAEKKAKKYLAKVKRYEKILKEKGIKAA